MKMWLEDCDMFLGEMMRHEGHVQTSTNCPLCSEGLVHFECRDCHGQELLCQQCLVEMHVHNLLHWIKVCASSAVLQLCERILQSNLELEWAIFCESLFT